MPWHQQPRLKALLVSFLPDSPPAAPPITKASSSIRTVRLLPRLRALRLVVETVRPKKRLQRKAQICRGPSWIPRRDVFERRR